MPVPSRVFLFAAAVFVGLSWPSQLYSQAVYGSVVGTVLDASGAAIAGARVTIRNIEHDITNATTANESGITVSVTAFNFFNHTNLGQPNGCVDCPGVAGRIFNAIGNYVPRQWQMAVRFEF